ncbi:DBH-like monooxygenase protein 1 homolog isoform X2 [Anneissia japonica]|nr:DBH-like monooxygenase protein 1 homolog isoform X2 [Anneissia japonica]XP_033099693.1 DBH-like monooxygenase protein 1 homolog isoform X2 [Anneissia japonica]
MKGADIMIGWVNNGTPYISDRHGIGNVEPEIDNQGDYELLYGNETNGLTIIGYQRKLLTCDKDDYDITSDTVRVIWSYHPEDPEDMKATYHGPQQRGVRSIIFLDIRPSNLKSLPEDVKAFDILNNNTLVPSDRATTYWCTHIELPALLTPHHIIRIEPIIQPGNEGVVHHLVLRLCYGLQNIIGSNSLNCEINLMYQFRFCSKTMYAWAAGGGALDFPEHVGFRIGVDDVRYLQLTVHYDNLQLIKGIHDSSGVRIYYTPELRKYDSSILTIGIPSFRLYVIPPKENAFKVYGSCDKQCSNKILTEGDMKVFSVLLHAHLAGTSMRLTHFRNGEYIGEIARDRAYDFNLQEERKLKNQWIVKPGDDLFLECTYNTMDRETVTYGGPATTDEMCLAFLSYYPKANAGICYNTPNPINLENLLNLGDIKNNTLRQAIDGMEWTDERKDAVRQWYKTSRLGKCTNHSVHSVFPEYTLLPGYSEYVETESLEYLINLQSQIVEHDKCSAAVNLKAALLSAVTCVIAVTLFSI